jgi:hypothetical protein
MTKLLSISFTLCLLLVLSGINRGFDISDEGLYVLLTQPLQENKQGVFSYDLFFKAFYQVTGFSFSIVSLRLVRLISYLFGVWALASAWKTFHKESRIRADIFLIMSLGIFAGYSFLPPSLSYNSLTLVLACFWLYLLLKDGADLRRKYFLGAILGILVYVKFPSAVVLGLLTLVFFARKKQLGASGLLGLIFPFLILEASFLLIVGENFIIRISEGHNALTQRPDYNLLHLLKINAVGGFWVLLVGIPFGLSGFFRTNKLSKMFFILGCLLTLFSIWKTHITEEWNHLGLLLFACLLAYLIGLRFKEKPHFNWEFIGLLVLPFLLHLGSNVYWLRLGIHFWVFWIFAALLLVSDYPKWKSQVFGIVGFLVPIGVFTGIWWKPFELPKPLWESNTPFHIPNGETILLDSELANVAEELNAHPEINSRKELLAIYRNPGIVYLLGKTMPLSPGIWDQEQLEQVFLQEEIPEALLFQGRFSLPQKWSFQDSSQVWELRGSKLILLK